MFLDPVEVGGGGGGEAAFGGAFARGADRIGDDPSMALGVAVGEREVGGSVMEGAGEVAPLGFIEAVHVEAVVERIGMFIEEDEDVCGADDISGFEELSVVGVEAVGEHARVTDE